MGMLKLNFKSKSKVVRAGLGVMSLSAAFIGWGFVSQAFGVSAPLAPASLAGKSLKKLKTSESDRQALLSDAKPGQQKGASETSVIFNDPFIQNKWGLERTSAQKAWQVSQGSKDIIVAVIDTGIDKNHRNLSENLWENPGENGLVDNEFCRKQKAAISLDRCNKAQNQVDDDGNGFIDDVHGWNFVHNTNDLTDNHGHGSHIAGIIGARAQDGFGINGVSPHVSLMILKYYDPKASNSNNLKNTIQAIRYAIKMKARIINYSGGGTDYSAEEHAAVQDAEKAGILFVAAAGNEKSNSDEAGKHYYPADYGLSNIISVTAVNREENKVLASSNYGVRTVDIAAPGENIYSTLPNNSFGFMTGTSQATAFVSGVAALVMAHNSDLNASDVKKYILHTGDEYATLLSKTGSAKLLNSYKALVSLDRGVGLTGVVASNTAKIGNSFNSDRDLKDPKFNNSAMNPTPEEAEEPAEAIASFGRDFIKAVQNGNLETASSSAIVHKR
jgi:thermitase